MKLNIYQADAFSAKLFSGNPAAVVPLKKWLPDALMQKIAMENNLSETVFFVPSKHKGVDYDIRWFTPAVEINLCGHATLAASFIIIDVLQEKKKKVVFSSQSGLLIVEKKKDVFEMDFPSWKPSKIYDYPKNLQQALGVNEIVGVYKYRDLLIELNHENDVIKASPDFTLLKEIGDKVIITAAGKDVDFVSRFFAPTAGVDEDPVTGSAHAQLIPFWSEKSGKKKLTAKQLSKRGGTLYCEQLEDRVRMAGKCILYLKGKIEV